MVRMRSSVRFRLGAPNIKRVQDLGLGALFVFIAVFRANNTIFSIKSNTIINIYKNVKLKGFINPMSNTCL